MSLQNVLTQFQDFDVSKMCFSPVVENKIKTNSSLPITYRKINISYDNCGKRKFDASISQETNLILKTPHLFSFGLSQQELDNKKSHVLPLCLYSRDGVTPDETLFVQKLTDIVDKCKSHLISVRKELKMPLLDEHDLKKFNCLVYKRDDSGVILKDSLPMLYVKLTESNAGVIYSKFYDSQTSEEIRPLDLMAKYITGVYALKVESIYIGSNRFSLQIKLYEASVSQNERTVRRLL